LEFKEYQHIVKLDDPEVEGLLVGKCYIFPKIDGTNANLWCQNEIIRGGSRRRVLDIHNDNQGFLNYVLTNTTDFSSFFTDHPDIRLYGEWLVPHTLKTYRDDAWRKFYVFDVTQVTPDGYERYIPYEEYKQWLDECGIDYISPIRIITNPTHEDLMRCVQLNTFLIKEDSGIGEGIVVKNYDFVNRYGRITWGKIVTNEFKDKHYKDMGAPERDTHLVEKELVDKFLDQPIVDKVYANILNENKALILQHDKEIPFDKKWIPQLLNTVYYEFVREEIWSMVKWIDKEKLRSIDFKNLKQHSFNKVREYYPQLFRREIKNEV